MADPLAGVPDAAPADTSTGIPLRRLVMPWDDLLALDPPADYLRLSPGLAGVIAALVGQSGEGPRLLTSDIDGRLLTAGGAPQSDVVVRGWDQPSQTFRVANPSIWAAGMLVWFPGLGPTVDGSPQVYRLTLVQADGTVSFDGPGGSFGPGINQLMFLVPPVAVMPAPVSSNKELQSAPLGAALAAGATSVVVPATAAISVRLHDLTLSIGATGAGPVNLEWTDGTHVGDFASTGIVSHYAHLGGLRSPTGLGVQLHNVGGAGVTTQGIITYRQEATGGG